MKNFKNNDISNYITGDLFYKEPECRWSHCRNIKQVKDITLWWILNNEEIGYEVELNTADRSINEDIVAQYLWIWFDYFKPIDNSIIGSNILPWLPMKMSHEYYKTTIEINFAKHIECPNLHKKVRLIVKQLQRKFWLTLHGNHPSFVWTHIHFFNSSLYNQDENLILYKLLHFIIDNIDDLHINSIRRIINSHQLWGNYAHSFKSISEILLRVTWLSFSYSSNSYNRPKYRPIIKSPRTKNGKWRSLEIRLIPTEFIVNKKIIDLLKVLKNTNDPDESIDIEKIFHLYSKICNIYIKKLKDINSSLWIILE